MEVLLNESEVLNVCVNVHESARLKLVLKSKQDLIKCTSNCQVFGEKFKQFFKQNNYKSLVY